MREGDAEADSGLGQHVPTTWPARLPAVGGFARRKGRRRSPNGRFEWSGDGPCSSSTTRIPGTRSFTRGAKRRASADGTRRQIPVRRRPRRL